MTVPNGNVTVGNKRVSDLQENLTISPIDPSGRIDGDEASGTLHYVTGFATAIDGDRDGYFLAVSIRSPKQYDAINVSGSSNNLVYSNHGSGLYVFEIIDKTKTMLIRLLSNDNLVGMFSLSLGNDLVLEEP